MRPDLFRIKAQADPSLQHKDSGEPCNCNGYHFKHKTNSKNCEKYEDFVIESAIAGRRQSDVGATDENEVPF